MNKYCLRVVMGVCLTIHVGGCSQPNSQNPTSADEKPRVVATSTIIADLTEKIGRDEIQLTSILKPGADPHVYEPVPADSRSLEKAKLILYNGYNLEPGLIKLMNSTAQGRKIAVGEAAKPLQIEKRKDKPYLTLMCGVM